MPSNSGADSWDSLLKNYGLNVSASSSARGNRGRKWPLSLIPTGYYWPGPGLIDKRITDGYWWIMTGYSSYGQYGYFLNAEDSRAYQNYGSRGMGNAIRCVVRS